MNFSLPKTMFLTMLPPRGSLRVNWERVTPPTEQEQEIRISITPDHLPSCTAQQCAKGCPSKILMLIAKLFLQ